ILRDADTAMYRAKAAGKGCYAVFDQDMHKSILRYIEMESGLRRALEEDAFTLVYQGIHSLATLEVEGFEALLRWNDRKLGFVPPGEFIAVAEEAGLIPAIGIWVIKQ